MNYFLECRYNTDDLYERCKYIWKSFKKGRTSVSGVHLAGFVTHRAQSTAIFSINSYYFSKLFKHKAKPAIRSKGRELLTKGALCDKLQKLDRELLPHPAYDPELAPYDYTSFDQWKASYVGIDVVQNWHSDQPIIFSYGIRILQEKWVKCMNIRGDYANYWQNFIRTQ